MKNLKKCIFCSLCFMLAILSIISLIKSNNNVVFAEDLIDIDVKEYCLMDSNSGMILAEKNSTEKREVASMVKLMTSLLTIEKIERNEWSLDTELLVSEYAASMEGSQAFLDAGKSYKIEDLLKSVIIASANDSSVVLAENYVGSETKFVDIMNKRAKELGLFDTLYGNSTGLPALNQYSTAKDIAKLLNIVVKHDLYHKYSTIWIDKLVHESGRMTELVNTNRLIRYYPGCDSGKTGFTDEAGYCLSATAKRNDMRLVSVVMGAKSTSDRFEASSKLLNYGFANFKNVKVVDKSAKILTDKRLKGLSDFIECLPDNDLYLVEKCGEQDSSYQILTEFFELGDIVKQGDLIGTIKVLKDDKVLCTANLVSADNYKTPNLIEITHKIFSNWNI